MTLNDLLSSSALTAWLPILDAIAKATIILGVAGVTTVLLRRASAASRHLVWTAALLARFRPAGAFDGSSALADAGRHACRRGTAVADGENTSAAGRERPPQCAAGDRRSARGRAHSAARGLPAVPGERRTFLPRMPSSLSAALLLVVGRRRRARSRAAAPRSDRGAGDRAAHDRRHAARRGCRWRASWRRISGFHGSRSVRANAPRCRWRIGVWRPTVLMPASRGRMDRGSSADRSAARARARQAARLPHPHARAARVRALLVQPARVGRCAARARRTRARLR